MNRLGFVVVYLSWAYALVVLVWTVSRVRRADRSEAGPAVARALAVAGAWCVVASFFLPWIEWIHPDTGEAVKVETGWQGLDPLSTGTVALLAVALTVWLAGSRRGPLVVGQAACLVDLTLGNALIQATTTRGTEPLEGAAVALAGAAAVAVGTAWWARPG